MSLIVQKFGGSSVADKERLFNVAGIISDAYRSGDRVVVVVSAQGDTTDDLLAKAAEISDSPSKRELDMLLSTGEQISASLLAIALGTMRIPVVSLNAWQVGISSDSNYSNAKIKKIDTERLFRELDGGKVVIVTGFQGINKFDDVTTLGRGGSDTTAVALAAVLKADRCQIYTDVDGVYTADPRKVPSAKKLKEISYIHAEGYAAGELKHGPLALLDSSTPTVAACVWDMSYEKMLSAISEVAARDSPVLGIGIEGDRDLEAIVDKTICIPEVEGILSPIPLTVVVQLIAYHTARKRSCPIDRPKNLAKSVTVD